MNVALRTRKFETTYIDGDITKPKFKRVGKYQKNKDGTPKMKGDKKVKAKFTNPSEQFYLDIYRKGEKREYQYLDIFLLSTDNATQKEDKRNLAMDTRNKVEQEYSAGQYDNVLPKYRRQIDFIKYSDLYLETYPNKDKRKVVAAIKHFKAFYSTKYKKDTLPMASFKKGVANDFIKYLAKDSKLSGGTPIAYLKKIKSIVKAAHFDRYMNENPFQYLSTKQIQVKDTVKKEVLTENELIKLFKTPCGNEFIRRAFFLGCYSGMGMAEIKKLKWKDVNFIEKTLNYTRGKTQVKVNLALNIVVEKLFFGLDRKTKLLFGSYTIPSNTAINNVLKTWVRRAGIDKHITFYCSRHTFGTRVLRNAKNLKVVAETMGHSSTRFTENYARIIDDEDKKAVMDLPDIDISVNE
tara:strand:- start:86 stop:1309 length:1224 start_codon:yes stop_codon:yes gene_type:complete